ncbi:MAG: diguanylate cyclase [Gallionellaceae bacterium]|jgi:diguanylate cyclase (GGDEF)-like protein/PAS domain S-box-containing protein
MHIFLRQVKLLLALPHSFARRLFAGMLLLNLVVIGLAALTIHEDRREQEKSARTSVQNISQLLANDLGNVFDRSDLVLKTVVDEFEKQLARGSLQRARLDDFLKRQQSHLPEIIGLRVTDENGLIRYGEGIPAGSPVDISDREHFILQRGNRKAGLVIGRPITMRISTEWAIPLSRRINYPDGRFAGIVGITIPVAHFVKQFDKLDLGSHGLIAMRSTDNVSMARHPGQHEGGGAIGQFAISDQLRSLLKDNPFSVTYVAPSPVDKIERIFNYQKLAEYPVYVVTGLATQDIMQEWQKDTVRIAALLVLFTVMTMLFARLLVRSWNRQMVVSGTLRENEQRLGFALESGHFSVWDWDIASGKIELSSVGKRWFGYDTDVSSGHIREWIARINPDDKAHVRACTKDHFRGRTENLSIEFRIRCQDGSWKWILARGLVVNRAADGKPLRMIGLHSDISERKHAEEELRLSFTVFNLADEGMVVSNPQNEIISVNPAFSLITGYAAEEVIGKNPRILSARTHSKEFYKELWSTLIETGSWSGEVLNRKKDGEVYVEWLTIKRVLNEQGELTHHVAIFSDITARKAAEDRMRHLALHDALTDLPNRALLNERLEQAIIRARRDKLCLGLLYFDLDRFKPVNDTYGHEVGDWLLKSVAIRVSECVRESDTVARIGGDEFVVLLPILDKSKDALAIAEKIRAVLGKPFEFAELSFDISASIGVGIYPEHGTDGKTLTHNADTAMYQAKKNGRNRAVIYHAGMQQD